MLLLFGTSSIFTQSKKFYLDNNASSIEVLGTSSLHDWSVQSATQNGSIVFSNLEKMEITFLTFSLESESLKSGKSGMDKKMYSTLNTDKHKTISFVLNKTLSSKQKTETSFEITVTGNLLINGVEKAITLQFSIEKDENISIIEGTHKILLTDFDMKPPKAMLGIIKVGNEIEIKFKSVFKS